MATITEHDVTYDAGVNAGNRRIHYLAAGPVGGPLIIFVHGWPAIAYTWKPQLETFASLGFRVVSPDMPGYGKSEARKDVNDYSNEKLVAGLLAVLGDTGRDEAVWVGHDWGAGAVSSFVAHYPGKCKALVLLCVPYRSVELGLDALLKTVNRDVYPADQYPYGQWDYMRYYEESFEKAVAGLDSDIAGLTRAIYSKSSRPSPSKLAPTATVRKQGGWFWGVPTSPTATSVKMEPLVDQDTYNKLVAALERTSFLPACAYYLHHKENHAYNTNVPNDGELSVPALFVHATYDVTCETKNSQLADGMRQACKDLTEITFDAGHWVALEKPREINAALSRFLVEKLPEYWPVSWDDVSTKIDG